MWPPKRQAPFADPCFGQVYGLPLYLRLHTVDDFFLLSAYFCPWSSSLIFFFGNFWACRHVLHIFWFFFVFLKNVIFQVADRRGVGLWERDSWVESVQSYPSQVGQIIRGAPITKFIVSFFFFCYSKGFFQCSVPSVNHYSLWRESSF